MSHTSKHRTKISDIREIAKIARANGHDVRTGKWMVVKLWDSEVPAEIAIKLKGWKYEIAITKEGNIMYDAFGTPVPEVLHLRDLIVAYNEKVIMKNIPMDKINSLWVNNVGEKKEITLTYN